MAQILLVGQKQTQKEGEESYYSTKKCAAIMASLILGYTVLLFADLLFPLTR
jgi:hypothetical protein